MIPFFKLNLVYFIFKCYYSLHRLYITVVLTFTVLLLRINVNNKLELSLFLGYNVRTVKTLLLFMSIE